MSCSCTVFWFGVPPERAIHVHFNATPYVRQVVFDLRLGRGRATVCGMQLLGTPAARQQRNGSLEHGAFFLSPTSQTHNNALSFPARSSLICYLGLIGIRDGRVGTWLGKYD